MISVLRSISDGRMLVGMTRGGKREGAGRKPLPEGQRLVARTVRVTRRAIERWDHLCTQRDCTQAEVVLAGISALENSCPETCPDLSSETVDRLSEER